MHYGLVNVYRTYYQPSESSGKDYQKIEGSMKLIKRTQSIKSGSNCGVRSVSADRSVA
jgi:hypothetical protein